MYTPIDASKSIASLAKSLAAFQAEVKQPLKDANNPFFNSKYVPLESVVEAITAVAPKHGLSFTQWATTDISGRVLVHTMMLHESGENIVFDPIAMTPESNKAGIVTPQSIGSAITYAKRYALSAVFGITSDQDDDGNEASGNGKTKSVSHDISKARIEDNYNELVKLKSVVDNKSVSKPFEDFYNESIKQKATHEVMLRGIEKQIELIKQSLPEKEKK